MTAQTVVTCLNMNTKYSCNYSTFSRCRILSTCVFTYI